MKNNEIQTLKDKWELAEKKINEMERAAIIKKK